MSSSEDEELSNNYSTESLELKGFLSKWTNCEFFKDNFSLIRNVTHLIVTHMKKITNSKYRRNSKKR